MQYQVTSSLVLVKVKGVCSEPGTNQLSLCLLGFFVLADLEADRGYALCLPIHKTLLSCSVFLIQMMRQMWHIQMNVWSRWHSWAADV